MRVAVLALSALLVTAPADASCAHVVTDPNGDALDASLDVRYADLGTPATYPAVLDVVVTVANAAATPPTGRRVVFTGFDLGAVRFVAEHVTEAGGAATGHLWRVDAEWPTTPVDDNPGPWTFEYVAPVPAATDAATGRLRVRVPLDLLQANGATVSRGTTVGRIDVAAFAGTGETTLWAQVQGDYAERPSSEPFRLGDPSCA